MIDRHTLAKDGFNGILSSGEEGAIRLTDTEAGGTPGLESGILEIFHAGAWGTTCSGNFGFLEVRPEKRCPGIPHAAPSFMSLVNVRDCHLEFEKSHT